ncbi:unnamed protein product, partial [marine sediment metagenome]
EQDRIGCPVVTDEGFVLFITGKRVARKLSKFERIFNKEAFMVTRHGEAGDINATYDISILDNKEKTAQLFGIAKQDYKPALLKQAIEDAVEVMTN